MSIKNGAKQENLDGYGSRSASDLLIGSIQEDLLLFLLGVVTHRGSVATGHERTYRP